MQAQKVPKTVKMNHRIDFNQFEKLEEAARVYGVTKSEITRAALDEYLTSLGFMQNDPAV
ncbi:ribbon-helix-helix domain-containing protein [Trichocoleus sp. DQ-A3]|uniref:ribbon-helix-helix domain-containing protein n=1 Tax=Cyanophyceae TaxID=3028117 RepID=UPI001682C527|nr:ribbon-helix-helix domain-containing protein [Coleofasciculus sp. FACHB-125]MBD1903887.1 CopG family transcriptional regulator [Coleofasciculus sp. FACHB-125]